MLRRVARLGSALALAACSSPWLPPMTSRTRIVPVAVDRPTSCDDEHGSTVTPRPLTALEERMRSRLRSRNDEPDIEACRILCRRALGPGDDVVACFRAAMQVRIGCVGAACRDPDRDTLQRAAFCGAAGERTRDDLATAQAKLPFVVASGDEVVVCSLK